MTRTTLFQVHYKPRVSDCSVVTAMLAESRRRIGGEL
jgi:hypothetical protein